MCEELLSRVFSSGDAAPPAAAAPASPAAGGFGTPVKGGAGRGRGPPGGGRAGTTHWQRVLQKGAARPLELNLPCTA